MSNKYKHADQMDLDIGFQIPSKDLVGKIIGDARIEEVLRIEIRTVKEGDSIHRHRDRVCRCTCLKCGRQFEKTFTQLSDNPVTDCGCGDQERTIERMNRTLQKHIGEVIGGLKIVGRDLDPNSKTFGQYEFECLYCHKHVYRHPALMRQKLQKFPDMDLSCGCRAELNQQKGQHKKAKFIGYLSRHPLYFVWQNMHDRCYRKRSKAYKNYGARGIYVCEEWRSKGTIGNPEFLAFYYWAISHGWKPCLKLDRRRNSGPYAPWNCRWITNKDNTNNTRVSWRIRYMGKEYYMSDFCSKVNGKGKRGFASYYNLHLNDPVKIDIYVFEHIYKTKLNVYDDGSIHDQDGFTIILPHVERYHIDQGEDEVKRIEKELGYK